MNALKTSPQMLAVAVAACSLSLLAEAETVEDYDGTIEEVVATYQQAYRGDVPENERPQAIDTIGRLQMDQAGITDFQSTLDMTPTVSRQNDMGGLWDSYSLRGFPSDENMPAAYLINGYSGGRGYSGRRDTVNIDEVEVILGPGSALYGRSDPGGVINIITLKPEYFTEGHVTAEAGSFNHKRVEADITGALGENLAGRINGAWEDSDSFRDEVTKKKQTVTPSLLWDIDEYSTLLYEGEYVHQEAPLDRGIVVLNNDFDTVDYSNFYGEPSDGPIQVKAWGHQLSYQTEFENGWLMTAGLGQRTSISRGYSSDTELASGRQTELTDDDTTTNTLYRFRRYADYNTIDRTARLEVSGELETGALVHHLMVGADTYRYFSDAYQLQYRGTDYGIDLYDPEYGAEKPDFAATPKRNTREYQQSFGVYLQNQMEVTESLQLLLGARFDNYHQSLLNRTTSTTVYSNERKISPRYGAVYTINDNVNVYANYSTGFMPVNGADSDGNPYKPEESRSKEIGSKFTVAGWSGSVAVFDAYKSNILTANTATASSIQMGEIRSTGVELSMVGKLTDSTDLMMSYAWLNSRHNKTYSDASWWIELPQGTPIANVPKNTLYLHIGHELALNNYPINLGASYRYVDERLGDTVTPSYVLPAYQLVDVNAGIDFGNGFSSKLVVSNLFNEEYISNSYNQWWNQPGEPRNIKASVTYDF